METSTNIQREFKRVGGALYEFFIIKNDQGKIIQRISIPLKVELKIYDIMENVVGANILAVPVAFTEEVWDMGDQLPWFNILLLSLVSILFMGSFIYFTSYRKHLKMFRKEYAKRIISTYFLSLLIVGLLLTIVDKCPWTEDLSLALKRTIIGAFPASLSATVTDNFSSSH